MARNRMGLQFSGFDEVLSNFDKAGGDIKRATEAALKAGKQAVTPDIAAAIRRHRRSGRTEMSLDKDVRVNWEGLTAEISVGFRIRNGGLPSIFLMYGTPRVAPDKALYNSVYGARTKKKIAEVQKETVNKVIQRTLGG